MSCYQKRHETLQNYLEFRTQSVGVSATPSVAPASSPLFLYFPASTLRHIIPSDSMSNWNAPWSDIGTWMLPCPLKTQHGDPKRAVSSRTAFLRALEFAPVFVHNQTRCRILIKASRLLISGKLPRGFNACVLCVSIDTSPYDRGREESCTAAETVAARQLRSTL